MLFSDGVGMRMDALSPLEGDCDYGDIDGARYSDAGTDFDGSLNTRLQHRYVSLTAERATRGGEGKRTSVAEMPGYPTRKFVFGRPDTRTKAVIFSQRLALDADHQV